MLLLLKYLLGFFFISTIFWLRGLQLDIEGNCRPPLLSGAPAHDSPLLQGPEGRWTDRCRLHWRCGQTAQEAVKRANWAFAIVFCLCFSWHGLPLSRIHWSAPVHGLSLKFWWKWENIRREMNCPWKHALSHAWDLQEVRWSALH